MGLLYNIQRYVFTFIGDIKWSGIKRPFWFTVNGIGYQLKGEHYREVVKIIKPGDILIRRFEGYVDKFFIPGWWNHAGIYIGDDGDKPEQVIHAISEGVIQEDLLNFMRTDHMCILRAAPGKGWKNVKAAIKKAKAIVGQPYDFGFDFKDTHRFSCTELAAYCHPGLVEGKKRFGKYTLIADDFKNSDKLKVVWDSTQNKIHTMGVAREFLSKKCPLKTIV